MDDLIDDQLDQQRSLMILLGTFAVLAVLLAAIGLYGLMTYSVVRRTREVGIRRALGALEFDILAQVMGSALGLTVAGGIAGLAGAFALTRFLQSFLFHITATDPMTFAAVTSLLILIAAIASYLPALRATKVDPMSALRME